MKMKAADFWDRMEEFCKKISGHDDIFYGTNREVLLQFGKGNGEVNE